MVGEGNMTELFAVLALFIPLAAFLMTLMVRWKRERSLANVSYYAAAGNLIVSLVFLLLWLMDGASPVNIKGISLYRTERYNFFIDLLVDRTSILFLLVGNIICFLVVLFSRRYMHREEGFKRFFVTVLFFYFGYTITVLSGNFETLFIGWEVLGLSSFLLVAYYRLRILPVTNSVKVFTIYRIGDIGILLATWMSHHLWHGSVTFATLQNFDLVEYQLKDHNVVGISLSLMILMAAMAKSAQLPFSVWLPRAMEGPTPSSAIFYGSLSVHIGVFLLLRTQQFWLHLDAIRWLIVAVGLSTFLVTTMISRVQPTIKGQIAYRSSAQIGIIFIEIAAGWNTLALLHFAGNALLRTYQLLVSPSVVAYMVREQFYYYVPGPRRRRERHLPGRLRNAIYLLSLREWYLDKIIFEAVFVPLKELNKVLRFLNLKSVFILIPVFLAGLYAAVFQLIPVDEIRSFLAILFGLTALAMVAKSYNERRSSRLAWILIVFSHFYIYLAIAFNDEFDLGEALIYLNGIAISGIIGYIILNHVRKFKMKGVGLNSFHGLVSKFRLHGLIFLLACLGISGFPVTSTFIGEDLILNHIREEQIILAIIVSQVFILNGITVIRIYARVFLGKSSRNFQTAQNLTI